MARVQERIDNIEQVEKALYFIEQNFVRTIDYVGEEITRIQVNDSLQVTEYDNGDYSKAKVVKVVKFLNDNIDYVNLIKNK